MRKLNKNNLYLAEVIRICNKSDEHFYILLIAAINIQVANDRCAPMSINGLCALRSFFYNTNKDFK